MRIFLFTICTFLSLSAYANKWSDLLDSLDIEVAKSNYYIEKKENHIARLKENLQVASFLQDRYLSCKQIFMAYSKFNPDSAEHYLRKCYEYGLKANNPEWQQEVSLDLAYVHTLRSDFLAADIILKKLPPIENISSPLQPKYAQIKVEEAMRLKLFCSSEEFQDSVPQKIWNQYSPYLDPNNYYIYKNSLDQNHSDPETGEKLREILSRCKADTHEKAAVEYCVYGWLNNQGNQKEAFIYLVRSAITDIRLANRDSQSILEIVRVINKENEDNEKQLERIYNYTLLCSDNIRIYKDIGRSIQLAEAQKQIQKSYKQLIDHKRNVTRIILLFSIVLIILIFILCWSLWKKHQYKSLDCTKLNEQNEKTRLDIAGKQESINELEQKTKELTKAIEVRDKNYIEYLRFNINSANQLKQFKKNVVNQLAAGRLSETKKFVSESLIDDKELSALYEHFDTIFLSTYPDFVERFNALLRPEARITLENPRNLTPELRIYALVCLGVTESVSIAEYLHYSTQTIYNYRLKTRHASIVPEKNFAEAVANLYK